MNANVTWFAIVIKFVAADDSHSDANYEWQRLVYIKLTDKRWIHMTIYNVNVMFSST